MTVTASHDHALDTAWRTVELFGGALTAQLPERFGDISNVRPVPDHQEVWGDPATDQSVLVEIMEHSAVADADVGSFVFNDLVQANEATSSSISSTRQLDAVELPQLPAETHAVLVTGSFKAPKGRDAEQLANSVLLLLAVLRFPQHATDVLVSVNAPLFVSAGSSAGVEAGAQPGAQQQAAAVMQRVLFSLCVHDWGLFGG